MSPLQAREEYRELKHKRKVEWAAVVIQVAYVNFQVKLLSVPIALVDVVISCG